MSALFTDHHRKCVACGATAGAWPVNDRNVPTCPTCGAEQATAKPSAATSDVLLVVALKTDQPNIERRLKTILAAAEPFDVDTEACVYAKPVDDLVAADLDALAALIGWDAVSRLRVGDVVAVGFQHPSGDAAIREGVGSAATNDPQCQDCGDSMIDCPTCGYGMEANP